MSVDRDPRPGDRFRYAGGFEYEVALVGNGLVAYQDDQGCPHARRIREWREHATLVAPRPTISAEMWGVYYGDSLLGTYSEDISRRSVAENDHGILIRIINGRICDEHGRPLGVTE